MKKIILFLIRAYQVIVSPVLPPGTCRFYPTCSHYALDAVAKYGPSRGVWLSIKRVSRCHPFHPGGYDPA